MGLSCERPDRSGSVTYCGFAVISGKENDIEVSVIESL